MASRRSMTFGQLNLAGSALATKELPAVCCQLEVDVVLLQEQYAQADINILQHGPSAKAGIYIHRQRTACAVLQHLSTDHCLVAHLEECDLHVISAYFQFAEVSTMGCPQGSVLGPALWNLLLDDLLRLPLPGGVRMVAYADDVTILIESQSRSGLEAAAKITLDLVAAWGVRNRLGFSPAKSSMMTMRGKFQRAPTVKLSGDSVRSVTSATVLGVVLDASQSFAQHAVSIGERAAKCFGKMSRVSASSWGIQYPGLRVLYRGTFVATITYAAACWYQRAALHVVRSALLRCQRTSLILLTKAYRSTSTPALAVLAGVLPADLEVIRAGQFDEERQTAAEAQVELGLRRQVLARRRREIWDETMDAWQKRWVSEEKGRELFRFFPDVAARFRSHWVVPDHQLSQILTGHGCFRKRLSDMKLCDVSVCYCGMDEEDLHHVLWVCPLYEEARCKMMDGISRVEVGPIYYGDLVSTPANFNRLKEFAHVWHAARSRMEREEA